MEKQTGRKIKELQIGNIERYMDQLLRFGQNTSMGTHFTDGIHGLAKKVNCSLLEKVRWLLSNTKLDKSFWAEAIVYASHLINGSTAIGGKTLLKIWSRKAAQDHGLLREFGSPTYFSAKDGKVNPRAKKFVFLGVKRNMKGYRLWDPENKKIVLSRHVTFDETSVLKSTVSQQVERTETKEVSQQVEVDTTPPSPVGSVSLKTSPDVTPGEDHVARVDTEQVEDIDENVKLFAAIGTKLKPRMWVKKHESQGCDRDKLKLKAVVLHDGSKEVHMTQPDRFDAEDSGTGA